MMEPFFALIFTIILFIGAAAYRIRGGGWISLSDSIVRLVWGIYGLCIPFLVCMMLHSDVANLPLISYAIGLIGLAFCAMLVPHAAYQNMGRWPTPQKTWPGFFLPTITTAAWKTLPPWVRTMYDCAGMAGVGLFRSLIVFVPFTLINKLFLCQCDWIHASFPLIAAGILLTFLSPICYLVGFAVPFTITASLTKHSTEWGEFLTGAAWVLAIGLL